MNFDGKQLLQITLEKAGFASLPHAVASMTLFLHQKTVEQTQNRNIFQIIRDFKNRGKIIQHNDASNVMACDNLSPTDAFKWAAGGIKDNHVQYNHIYTDSKNVTIYTSLANICLTPSFLAKLTDSDEEIKSLLRFRAYDLYGFLPAGKSKPSKPEKYADLRWMECPEPLQNLEKAFREKMKSAPKRRTSISAREIGWLFSDYKPDSSI